MHLRSIDILGFKSFPEKTHLQFSEGITALLGPNGCGKSNIVDAVKWALGEQSYKTLRADRMEDILFGGSENRKPLNVAEVTLVLSNEEEFLPLPVSEISIKRRYYRSGESEYYLNHAPALLREIRELFFDTGVGKSAYSIMEQGKIDQILSTRPEERRLVFEEAAGITKYRIKGAEAERKLERTRENMRQIEGIIGEVKRSYDSLRRQAEKTECYRTLKEKIFVAERDIQLLRLRGMQEKKESVECRLEEEGSRRKDIRQEIERINRMVEQNIDRVNSMESNLVEKQKMIYRIDLEKHGRDSQIKILQERTHELERKKAAEEGRERHIRGKLTSGQEELRQRKDRLEEVKAQIRDIETNIRGFEGDIQRFETRILENEREVDRLGQEAGKREAEVDCLRLDLRRITDDIVTQLDQKLKDRGYSAKESWLKEQEIESLLESLRIQLAGRSEILQDFSLVSDPSERSEERLLDSTRTVIQELRGKVERISELFEEYKRIVPSFLNEFLAPEGIITQKREIDRRITEKLEEIQEIRKKTEELQGDNKSLGGRIEEYRETLEELRVNKASLHTQQAGLKEELERLTGEISEQEQLLRETAGEIEMSEQRLRELEARIDHLSIERRDLEQEEERVKSELSELEKEIASRNNSLIERERELKDHMKRLEQVQADLEKLQMDQAEVKTEIRNLRERFRELYSRDLDEYESRIDAIDEPLKDLRQKQAELKGELKKLGQVNLMAPEEFAEVSERYKFLSDQLSDLKMASEDLKRVTEEIRQESSELFIQTYNQIKKNFHHLFRRLFGGGRAELKLKDPDYVLESGIDILAQPPGKKLENVNLLSGGEKSLTAIALLFATYMVKPSPFCLLDEIDAALDDQNVGRFINLLREFARDSQFIVITHNKKTVASSNTLLGVTMEESGVSKIVSLRLENKVEQKTSA